MRGGRLPGRGPTGSGRHRIARLSPRDEVDHQVLGLLYGAGVVQALHGDRQHGVLVGGRQERPDSRGRSGRCDRSGEQSGESVRR